MQKLLDTSGAARPTGSPPQKALFRVPSGVFKGRLAALYMSSTSAVKLIYSDYPYESWSTPQTIVSNSYDSPFSSFMDSGGNIHLVYTDSSKDIKYLEISFAAGAWTPGSAVDIITVDDNYNPFFLIDADDNFWCLFVNHKTSGDSKYYVRVKISDDKGATWGTGPTDTGTELSSGSGDIAYVAGTRIGSRLYVIYADGRSDLKYRIYDTQNEIWDTEYSIYSGNYIDDDFDMAASKDGKLSVAFAVSSESKLYFKEYDGSSWSGVIEVETVSSRSPQIAYFDSVPHIFYAKNHGSNYYSLRKAKKSGSGFAVSDYAPAVGAFDKVFLYDDSASTKYQDKTDEASSDTSGDVFHSESSALLESIEDCLYLGKQSRFYCVASVLSTAGAGGSVVWEYFDGEDWDQFTPDSGAYNFDSSDKLVYLWEDGESLPSDWQVTKVNNFNAYWIRIRVTAGFSTKPVGTQIIAATKCDDLALVREAA
ncbi:MAG: exo-alpha-sialidase [Candidatus Zixiibacteriota bacterium]|nr:MAG: exo-alpha-sialidase [candidate division Zixibacteria bacterium]